MKAFGMRGGLNPFKGKSTCEGGIADIRAFGCHGTQEAVEIDGQQACPFSLESCCDAIASERGRKGKGICPFTLESLDMPSLAYCRAVR